MILKIELTDDEYIATQKALTESYHLLDGVADSTFLEPIRLELLHLQTLLAEASIKQNTNGRCKACGQTAERCTDWGGSCCPLCKHSSIELLPEKGTSV